MPRKRSITAVRKNCDVLWSQLVRARTGGICERCGQPARESHHAYGRANYRLRFDPRNGVAYCYRCHLWAESYPIEFTNWFRGDRTEDAAYLSLQHQKGPMRRYLSHYLELEAWLQEQLAKWDQVAA